MRHTKFHASDFPNYNVSEDGIITNSKGKIIKGENSHVIEKASVAKYRKVKCITTGKIYNSIKEAADELGLYHSNIVACCNGRRATCGGLEWEYL